MNVQPDQSSSQKLVTAITRVIWSMGIAWTLITVGLYILNAQQHRQAIKQMAIAEARTHFSKDLAFRSWATIHGGVYVPSTEQTPPNPYLGHIPDRDIETPSGKKLTLMNPAYMTRQLFDKFGEQYEIIEHITSLQPLNPINAPDDWEKSALAAFAEGQTEFIEFLDFKGKFHLRLMCAMFVEKPCLKCHAREGYKEGDVRGGISVSLPMTALLEYERKVNFTSFLSLGIVWLLGLSSLLLGRHLLIQRINERCQAIEALEKLQSRHAEAQRIAHLGHWELDLTSNHLQWSEEMYRIFAKDSLSFNVSREAFYNAIHPEDREMVKQAYNNSVQNKTPYDIIHRLILADGSIKYVRERCETFFDSSGKPLHSLGTAQDITRDIEVEAALYESEEQLQLVVQGANLGTWDWNILTGTIVINERWAEMLGYDKEEIEPAFSAWKKLVHPDDAPLMMKILKDHLAGRLPFYQAEYRMQAKSGEWRWIHDSGQVVSRDASAQPIRAVGIHYDITANKQLEQRVLQQERLSAVGQLTAGIAHDFNNSLTSILGFAELLQSSPEMSKTAQESLAIIINSGKHASRLVRQMLDFSRKSVRSLKQVDLAPFVKEVVKFLQSAIPESISVSVEIIPGDYLVQADPTQIQQIMTNLALNARDAMPSGGELRMVLSRVHVTGELRCEVCGQPLAGVWASLAVTDTGMGMTPDVLSRIFEPFFTTKEVGKGSGLGLSQVLGIVKQHGGHIMVQSQPGQGTTFTVYFPLLLSDLEAEKGHEPVAVIRGQGETILLVEDEMTVLAVIKTMLQELGYQVLTATNGREALDVYEQHLGVIAMVLSDMVMPDMDGATLYATLKMKYPEIKVILMSGYPLLEKEAQLLEDGVVDWFQKPPSLGKMSQILHNALNRS